MSGVTPDDDGLRKRFLNHPSDLTHPTTTQVGQRIHRVGTVRGITGGREIDRGFLDSHESGHPDFQIRGLLCAQAVGKLGTKSRS
jgi:hypothetical protein